MEVRKFKKSYVNEDKKVVHSVVTIAGFIPGIGTITTNAEGSARCHDEEFDKKFGVALAEKRAKKTALKLLRQHLIKLFRILVTEIARVDDEIKSTEKSIFYMIEDRK